MKSILIERQKKLIHERIWKLILVIKETDQLKNELREQEKRSGIELNLEDTHERDLSLLLELNEDARTIDNNKELCDELRMLIIQKRRKCFKLV